MKSKYMNIALEEARKAYLDDEVPVGTVIVLDNKIISQAHNMKIKTSNPLHHAEILAIDEACKVLGDWRLENCEMYITLEPCPMCAGAILQSRIKKVYIGTKSNIKSNEKVLKSILNNQEYYHMVDIEYLNEKKCSELLTSFFAKKR